VNGRATRLSLIAGTVAGLALGGCSVVSPTPAASGEFADVPGLGSARVDVPRPTSGLSALCHEGALPPASDAPIETRVGELRKLGLFADRSGLSDEDLSAEITTALADQWGDVGHIPDRLVDLTVADQDRHRVWWRDLEADVVQENEVYAQTVAEWGEISEGDFLPTDIVETWSGDSGPVILTYKLAGVEQRLTPAYLEDWIDPTILVPINASIAASGRRFELYKAFDQSAFVMAITADERRAFEGRGWCFE
jgi:hypothetical protein